MRFGWIMVLCMALAGCASPMQKYATANRPLAEGGQLRWSEYYKGLFEAASASHDPNKGRIMGRANVMILASRSYEEGKISADQFAHLRREVQAAQATDDGIADARRNEALASALRNMSDSVAKSTAPTYQIVPPVQLKTPTTTTTNCNRYGSQVNCTSTSY